MPHIFHTPLISSDNRSSDLVGTRTDDHGPVVSIYSVMEYSPSGVSFITLSFITHGLNTTFFPSCSNVISFVR